MVSLPSHPDVMTVVCDHCDVSRHTITTMGSLSPTFEPCPTETRRFISGRSSFTRIVSCCIRLDPGGALAGDFRRGSLWQTQVWLAYSYSRPPLLKWVISVYVIGDKPPPKTQDSEHYAGGCICYPNSQSQL